MLPNKKMVYRLSQYKSALFRFQKLGFTKIFSGYIAESVGGTSAQVRKDFSLFGISGNKRGGYEINTLIDEIDKVLGKKEIQNAIIVGAGKMGSALVKYRGFSKVGINIVAAFDIEPHKYKDRDKDKVPVMPLDKMAEVVKKDKAEIGIITVPEISAQRVFEFMMSIGVKGFLNFAPINLRCKDSCVIVNNVTLESELETLIYFVNNNIKI